MKRRDTQSVSQMYPPELFDQLSDILAELVLEDMRQFPTAATLRGIDTVAGADNTPVTSCQGIS